MDKSTKKNRVQIYNPAKAAAINFAAKKTGVTAGYVRNILNGFQSGGRSEEILKLYKQKYAQMKRVMEVEND